MSTCFLSSCIGSQNMSDITPRKRASIISLWSNTQLSQRDIARRFGVNQSMVSRLLKQVAKTGSGSPQRKGKCGRKQKTSPRDDIFLIRQSKLDPRKTSFDLQRDLSHTGKQISFSTVRKRLVMAGRKAIRPVKKQLLTNKMKKKRLQWAKKYKSWTVDQWKKVMFSDESHFLVRGKHSQFVCKSAGEMLTSHHINESVKHPPKKMFWGGFIWKGVGSLVPIEGMMNTNKYIDVLKRRAFPDLKRAFPGENGIFQQDLSPCHSSRKTVKFFQENQVSVLDWPGNSPDLNPIENLWAIVKCWLRKMDCTTSKKLVEAIIHIWYHDDEILEKCKKLVESMPTRVNDLLKAKGGHIKY